MRWGGVSSMQVPALLPMVNRQLCCWLSLQPLPAPHPMPCSVLHSQQHRGGGVSAATAAAWGGAAARAATPWRGRTSS